MENHESRRENVTLYVATFRGIFGRNRTDKFKSTGGAELALPADTTDANLAERLDGLVQGFAGKFRAEIKPKRGILRVSRHEGCEVNTYQTSDGRTVTSHTIAYHLDGRDRTVYSQTF